MYVHGSEERLIQAAKGYKYLKQQCFETARCLEAARVLKKAKEEKSLQDWEDKSLHGQYLRQTKEDSSEQSWALLQNGDLKRETESLILAVQNQCIRTKLVKGKIEKPRKETLCPLSIKADESTDIVSGSSKLATEYKRRQNLGKIVH